MTYKLIKTIFLILSITFIAGGCSSDSNEKEKINLGSDPEVELEFRWTENNRGTAKQNCINSGNPDAFCECSVDILVTIFSYSEFIEFDAMIRSGQQPSDSIKPKMMEMSKRVIEECRKP